MLWGFDMKQAKFDGVGIKQVLSTGREVEIGRSHDGRLWALRFGVEGDEYKFCLSEEALLAMEMAIAQHRLRSAKNRSAWVVTWNGDA